MEEENEQVACILNIKINWLRQFLCAFIWFLLAFFFLTRCIWIIPPGMLWRAEWRIPNNLQYRYILNPKLVDWWLMNQSSLSVCIMLGTGFSEQQLEECSTSLRSKVIKNPKVIHSFSLLHDSILLIPCSVVLFYSSLSILQPYYRFADTTDPDVWFEPSVVICTLNLESLTITITLLYIFC